jgi:hypothetical protein
MMTLLPTTYHTSHLTKILKDITGMNNVGLVPLVTITTVEHCVGTKRSYANAIQGMTGKSLNMTDAVRQPTVNSKR